MGDRGSVLSTCRDFSLRHCAPTGCEVLSALYPMDIEVSLRLKRPEREAHFHLVPRSRLRKAYLNVVLRHRGSFTFALRNNGKSLCSPELLTGAG